MELLHQQAQATSRPGAEFFGVPHVVYKAGEQFWQTYSFIICGFSSPSVCMGSLL
jgi:hypothetical protein